MTQIRIEIVRFTDASYPGWVACELVDAFGNIHAFFDKVPIFSLADLDANSRYPQPGVIACDVMSRWLDDDGRQLVRIDTEKPFGVDSAEGVTVFVVLAEQVVATAE